MTPKPESMPRDDDRAPASAIRVLLADDQPDVLTALQLLLKSEGFTTRAAGSPEQVLAAVSEEHFDVLLVDLNYTRDTTSGEEGLDLLSSLKALPKAPPVLVMTAWGSIELAVEAMRRGARDFVTKPWENEQLVAALRRHVNSAEMREETSIEAPPSKSADRYSPRELEVASQVQQRLWPRAGRRLARVELSGHCLPVGAVGGDTFDFLDLGDESAAFALADISGKGLPAALMMAGLQAILRSGASSARNDLHGFIESSSRQFFESTQAQHYATLFFGLLELDGSSGAGNRLRYVSCGHPAGLLLTQAGEVRRLHSTATAFGLFETMECASAELMLGPGDTLLVFSDGLAEAPLHDGSELGEEGLLAAARRIDPEPVSTFPRRLIEAIVEKDCSHQADDMTVVLARAH